MKRLICFFLTVCLFVIAAAPLSRLVAQSDNIVLSLAIPDYTGDYFPEMLFNQFETDHPGVKVHLKKSGNTGYLGSAAFDSGEFFKSVESYTGTADVLYISSEDIGIESTRGGYWLDLSPLVRSDSTLDVDDFVSAAWQTFQWDGGIWALPITLDVVTLVYDPAAFDKAGLAYPSGEWTIDDLADAARKLTVKGPDGKVTTPGIAGYQVGALFRSASGENFLDESVSPSVPHFDKPGLLHAFETFAKLREEGVFSPSASGPNVSIPISIEQCYALANNIGMRGGPRSGSLLPGNNAGLSANGFAVSSGTQHPELAYALAKYLTGNARLAKSLSGLQPARKSLVNVEPSSDTPVFRFQFSPENQAFLQDAIDHALPPASYLLWQYLEKALGVSAERKSDAKIALLDAEGEVRATLETAANKRKTTTFAVVTPVPTPMLKGDDVALKFNLVANISPLPNREQWEKVIADFAASDPQVRQIVWDTGLGGDLTKLTDTSDCFIMTGNFLTTASIQDELLNLDPLINADTSVDRSDFMGDSLARLQHDNKTLGLPIYLQPEVLRYNVEDFNKAGIKLPEDGWDVSAFAEALKTLKVNPDDPAPFVPNVYGGTYLLMLIAAYGGVPLDTRTTPTTINFTDPATVDAIRQVLDLAKQGYIKYQKLTANGASVMGGMNTAPIYTDSLSMLSFYSTANGENNPYRLAAYPKGVNFIPVAYSIGSAYISAKTANPEACYRWVSTLSKHPELFGAMPARRSLLDDSGTQSQGVDVVNFYRAFDKALQDPMVLTMPADIASVDDYILQYFLNRVFDRYVTEENVDLPTALKEAELFAEGYQECTANITPLKGSSTPDLTAYYMQFVNCAIKIDPSLSSVFTPS
jgi:ABC-type glycerol-3-phosphate transport system substrate-binding protein